MHFGGFTDEIRDVVLKIMEVTFIVCYRICYIVVNVLKDAIFLFYKYSVFLLYFPSM
jgi:hypothetical protein